MNRPDQNNTSGDNSPKQGGGLDDLLTSLQQGVTAINNLTQAMSAIFPSS